MKYILMALFLLGSCPAFAEDIFQIEIIKSEHTLILRKNNSTVKQYDIITGREDRLTPVTETWFDSIDINPIWHPTAKSVEELTKHPEIAEKYGIVRTGNGGMYSPPSDKNPLGKARFNLHYQPRPIKIHGTSEPELFKTDRRNYSSGCIRVLEIKDLTEIIVGHIIDWDKDYTIKLEHPITVIIH